MCHYRDYHRHGLLLRHTRKGKRSGMSRALETVLIVVLVALGATMAALLIWGYFAETSALERLIEKIDKLLPGTTIGNISANIGQVGNLLN